MLTKTIAIITLMCFVTACASSSKSQSAPPGREEPCLLPPIQDQDSELAVLVPRKKPPFPREEQGIEFSEAAIRRPSSEGFSQDAVKAAKVLGILDLLQLIGRLQEKAASDDRAERRLLMVRQQFSDRLLLISVDTASLTAYMDCEISLTSHRATALESGGAERQRTRTIFGILGDALIGITAGFFSLSNLARAAAIASVSGGSSSTGAGINALFFGKTKMSLNHPQDVLRELWDAPPEPKLYPLPVWRFLNSPQDDQDGAPTKREALIAYWREQGWLGEPGSKSESRRLALFFSGGGEYQLDDLLARAQMLEVVKASVNLLNRELHRLLKEIQRRAQASIEGSLARDDEP